MKTRRRNKMFIGLLAGIFLIFGVNNALAAPTDIIINEIAAYEPDGHEWIEIYNKGGESVDLNGWVFYENATNHSLALHQGADMIIESNEYAIIADNAENFVIDYSGFAGTVIDSSWTTLSETGELIELRSSSDPLDTIESFTYISAPDFSLERANPLLNDYSAVNWQEHASGNTVGIQNSNYIISICGDGVLDVGEECDDNNLINNDGCSDLCVIESSTGVGGTVLLTITPNIEPVQNIKPTSADVVFQINDNGMALISYGPDSNQGTFTVGEAVLANVDKIINLSALECDTTYHYSIHAENSAATESDVTTDATFTTLPCGISINSLVMTKTFAKANNLYADGWEWAFDITVWNMNETNLKMKFDAWSGATSLDAGANMQFSADGTTWLDIISNNAYPVLGADLTGIDNRTDAGRQVEITVRMKVPVGTLAGDYNSNYGILTEE